MRAVSLAHTKLAMLSRACSGVRGQTRSCPCPAPSAQQSRTCERSCPPCRTAYASCVATPKTAGEIRCEKLEGNATAVPPAQAW
jgi:hypothetical protein